MDAVQKANAGHPGTAMALAPLGYTLFERFLRANPADTAVARPRPLRAQRGPRLHAAVLAAAPHRLRPRASRTSSSSASGARARPGHPERGHTPGIEVTTGPLGQGVANAVGMAIAERFLAERFNRPGREVVDHHIYVICSDGDMMEGDQPGGGVDRRPLRARQADRLLRRQPHHDRRHDLDLLRRREPPRAHARPTAGTCSGSRTPRTSRRSRRRSRPAREETERPSFIAIRSHIAYPAPNAVDTAKAHGAPLGEEEVRATKEVMGFDPDRNFWVDERVYEHMSLRERGRRSAARVGASASTPGARPSRRWPRTGTAPGRDACARAGARRCRAFAGRRDRSPRARPGRR